MRFLRELRAILEHLYQGAPKYGREMMPKFGILVARDDNGWWSYCLVIDHKIAKTATPFINSLSAFKAAQAEANIRGHLRPEE